MTLRGHSIFWGLVFAGFLAFVYLFKAILLPFVLALAISYFLEPVMKRLGKTGLNRGLSALVILLLFFGFVIALLSAILPLAYREMIGLSQDMPGYLDRIVLLLQPISEQLQVAIGQQVDADSFKAFFLSHIGEAANVGSAVAQTLLNTGQAFAGTLSFLAITPIIAYFMMKEWNKITNWIEDLMPRENKKTIADLLEQIDGKISGFVRGQITVAFILGLAYATALSLLGLKYGFLIGLVSGLLSIIPMVGSVLGLVCGIAVAWLQSSDWMFVAYVAGVFLVGQLIEGNFLTPRLVGGSVGMHPLWIFFALMAGGALFGILGMLLAVPVAAVIGVLAAFGIAQYKASAYYKGKTPVKKK